MKENKQYTNKHSNERQSSTGVQSYVSREARKELTAQTENKTAQVKTERSNSSNPSELAAIGICKHLTREILEVPKKL